MLNAAILVQPSCHTIWHRHADSVVRLNRQHQCSRRCGSACLRRCRNGGLQVQSGRRHIDARQARHGVGPAAECAAQQQMLSPGIELPAADTVLASHHRRRHTRLHAFDHDLVLPLGRPTTALAARVHLGAQAWSARAIRRTSIPRLRSALRHAVLLRHGRHLVRNGTRQTMCCCDPAYAVNVADGIGHFLISFGLAKQRRLLPARRRDRGVQAERGFTGNRNATKLTASAISSVVLGGSPLQRAEGLAPKGLSLDNRIGRKESRLGQRRNERICKWE